MESTKILKERVENFVANGGTIEQFINLYVENNEGTREDFLNEYATQLLGGDGTIFDKIGRGIEGIWKTITGFFSSLIDILNPFSENFFLKQLGNAIASGFQAIGDAIGNLVSNLLDGLGNLLSFLFVPSHNPFEDLGNKINAKFGFVSQIGDMFSNLLGFNNYGDSVPSFDITWMGTTFGIIDFSLFLQYRTWIHGIILAIAWAIFIFRTYKKLPSIIGGFSQ